MWIVIFLWWDWFWFVFLFWWILCFIFVCMNLWEFWRDGRWSYCLILSRALCGFCFVLLFCVVVWFCEFFWVVVKICFWFWWLFFLVCICLLFVFVFWFFFARWAFRRVCVLLVLDCFCVFCCCCCWCCMFWLFWWFLCCWFICNMCLLCSSIVMVFYWSV